MSEVVSIRGFMNNPGYVNDGGSHKCRWDLPVMFVTFRTIGDTKPTRKAIKYPCWCSAEAAMHEAALAMVADGWVVEGDYLVNGDTSVTFQLKHKAFRALKVPNRNGLPK